MADRDKYGNYVNDEGVDKPHDAVHVNVNYDKGTWDSTTHGPDKSDTSSGSGGLSTSSP